MPLQNSPGIIYDASGNSVPLKRAFKDATANTADQSVIAAVTGKKIRVHRIILSFAGTGGVVFRSKPGGAGANISMTFNGIAGQTVTVPSHGDVDKHGLFETVAGEALVVTTTGAGIVGVSVKYTEQ